MNTIATPEAPVTAPFKLPDGYAPGDTVLTYVDDVTMVVGMVSARDPGPETNPETTSPMYADWTSTGGSVKRGLVLPILVLATVKDQQYISRSMTDRGLHSPRLRGSYGEGRFPPLSILITDSTKSSKYDFVNEIGMVERLHNNTVLASGLKSWAQDLYRKYLYRSVPEALVEIAQAVALARCMASWKTEESRLSNTALISAVIKGSGVDRNLEEWTPLLEALKYHLTLVPQDSM